MATTKQSVRELVENFQDYVNPQGELDPWFEVTEINQQFVWDDVPEETLVEWLNELVDEGVVIRRTNDQGILEWRWKTESDD